MLNNRVRDANYFTPKCIYLSFKDHKRKASSNPQAKKRPVYSFHQNGSIFWVQKCISYLSVVSVYSVLIQCSVDCLLHFKNLSCSYIYVVLKWASLIPKQKIFHEFSPHHCFPKLLIFLLKKKLGQVVWRTCSPTVFPFPPLVFKCLPGAESFWSVFMTRKSSLIIGYYEIQP